MDKNKIFFLIIIGLLIAILYFLYVEHFADEKEKEILTNPLYVSLAIILPLGFPALALYSYITVNVNKK